MNADIFPVNVCKRPRCSRLCVCAAVRAHTKWFTGKHEGKKRGFPQDLKRRAWLSEGENSRLHSQLLRILGFPTAVSSKLKSSGCRGLKNSYGRVFWAHTSFCLFVMWKQGQGQLFWSCLPFRRHFRDPVKYEPSSENAGALFKMSKQDVVICKFHQWNATNTSNVREVVQFVFPW